MASAEYYSSVGIANLNNANATYDEIASWLPSVNPASTYSTPYTATYIDATKPTVKSNTEIINSLGIDKSYYDYDTIKSNLDANTNAAYESAASTISTSIGKYKTNMADAQSSAFDTLDSQYGQGTAVNIARSVIGSNKLSTMLDVSQTASSTLSELNAQLTALGTDWQATLTQNTVDATTQANTAASQISSLAETLYSDEIIEYQQAQAYNASVAQSEANYLANVEASDTSYQTSLSAIVRSIYNNNQSAINKVNAMAESAAIQDYYTSLYYDSVIANANAMIASS